jgi:hypothetical protein
MSRGLEGNIVLDTGAIIELLNGSKSGAYVRTKLQGGVLKAWTGELNIGEIRYLICRREGWSRSLQITRDLLDTNLLRIFSTGEFIESAAQMKCSRALSIVDCVTLSAGEKLQYPVLFSSHELELDKEIKKAQFKTEIFFLEDLLHASSGKAPKILSQES